MLYIQVKHVFSIISPSFVSIVVLMAISRGKA